MKCALIKLWNIFILKNSKFGKRFQFTKFLGRYYFCIYLLSVSKFDIIMFRMNNSEKHLLVFYNAKLWPWKIKIKNDTKRTNWRHVTTFRKWIGATEIYTILTYCGIEAELIDFHKPSGEQGTHPQLVNWVNTYYTQGSAKPPLYLQHQVWNRIFIIEL